ncbi:hypothetical protein, conserved [Plasmodium gonderi]|uniref:Uncharacterized protein n=1 Tax=Plasmodium gonderi TaxID=77519 RepID=A0A1Y1JB18_PLAGO|nr:hypothetical protein, conserved [Plasmodium gonderi]GAW79731.1 hypothetical protein, conserved [Plasmodium gonderi]
MSAKLPEQINKKGWPLPKSTKQFVKPPILLKSKGNLPGVLQKNKSEERADSDKNSESNLAIPQMKSAEPKIKGMKPKIKIPESKFNSFGGKVLKELPPLKIKPLSPKMKSMGGKELVHEKTESKGVEPKLKAIKSLKGIKFAKGMKVPKPNIKIPETKLKSMGIKERIEVKETQEQKSKRESVREPSLYTSNGSMQMVTLQKTESKDVFSLRGGGQDELKRKHSLLNKSKYFEKISILDKLKNQSVKPKGIGSETNSLPSLPGNWKLSSAPLGKEKVKHFSSPNSTVEKYGVIKTNGISISTELTKSVVSTKKEILKKGISKKMPPSLNNSVVRGKENNVKATINIQSRKEEEDENGEAKREAKGEAKREAKGEAKREEKEETKSNNIMVGVPDRSNREMVGPLSTFIKSSIVKNMNYINAFSRCSGNYMGKVTGPANPIGNFDKKPQHQGGKKNNEYNIQQCLHNGGMNSNVTLSPSVPFNECPYMSNYSPYYSFHNSIFQSATEKGRPICFPPGWYYLPMCEHIDPYGKIDPFGNIDKRGHNCSAFLNPTKGLKFMGQGNQLSEEITTNERKVRGKGKKEEMVMSKGADKGKMSREEGRNGKDIMVGAGYLKPLQFRNGVEWTSEDEKYLNADVSMEEERRKRKKEKQEKQKERTDKCGSKYIGDTRWYEIEQKLNNCRGVVVVDEERTECSESHHNIRSEDSGNEDDNEEDTWGNYIDESDDGQMYEYKRESDYARGPMCKDLCSEKHIDDNYEEETKHIDEEARNEFDYYDDTECDESEGECMTNRRKHILGKIKSKGKKEFKMERKKRENTQNRLEDKYNFDFDNIYKNYKIEYLKERLKWANEYLQKQEKAENGSNCNGNKKKKHMERLDDIAHLFLPKKKKHENLFDLSMNFCKISDNDKNDIINMLFSCRELEKLIEEQHCVLDMLDNDLRQVNASLKLPSTWNNFNNFEILQEAILNADENEPLPLNNTPLFIKGKVALIPKNLDTFFDKPVNLLKQDEEKITDDVSSHNVYSKPVDTPTNLKYMPKFAKATVKPKVSLLLKGGITTSDKK